MKDRAQTGGVRTPVLSEVVQRRGRFVGSLSAVERIAGQLHAAAIGDKLAGSESHERGLALAVCTDDARPPFGQAEREVIEDSGYAIRIGERHASEWGERRV